VARRRLPAAAGGRDRRPRSRYHGRMTTPPAQPLRWGFVGTARINRSIIGPLAHSARSTLAGVASRDAARAEAYAREWNIPRAFAGYESMLADPGIDVVYIGLPNGLHAEWTIRAVEHGKHVLCEKPLAVSVAEVDAIAEAARRSGKVVSEAFMYRHHPQTARVVSLVREGAVGELRLIQGSFTFNLTRAGDVRLDPRLGGGCLWDVGCYPVSYARAVAGSEPVQATGFQRLTPTGVDEVFVGALRFPGDVLAHFDASFRATFRTAMEIVGSEGTLFIPHPFKPGRDEGVLLVRGDERQMIAVEGEELYLGEIEDLAGQVLLGARPGVSLDDSRGNVAAIVALYQSAREGRAVAVPARTS
jgi:xylose dehydrogenase (NAD/NADP)